MRTVARMRSAAWLDEFAHRIPELPRATVNMNPLDHGGTPPPQDVRPPETILLVEDDAAAAARLLHLLARVYPRTEVQHAPELASARRILRCTVIDLALVDIHLPDGSGLELLYDRLHEQRDQNQIRQCHIIPLPYPAFSPDSLSLFAPFNS